MALSLETTWPLPQVQLCETLCPPAQAYISASVYLIHLPTSMLPLHLSAFYTVFMKGND